MTKPLDATSPTGNVGKITTATRSVDASLILTSATAIALQEVIYKTVRECASAICLQCALNTPMTAGTLFHIFPGGAEEFCDASKLRIEWPEAFK